MLLHYDKGEGRWRGFFVNHDQLRIAKKNVARGNLLPLILNPTLPPNITSPPVSLCYNIRRYFVLRGRGGGWGVRREFVYY